MDEKKQAVEQLRRLVMGEKDLYIRNDDDSILLLFLDSAEFDVQKTFKKMKAWYRLKADECSEWFAHRREEVHDNIIKTNRILLLGNRDQRGRRIFIIKLREKLDYPAYLDYQVHDLWLGLAFDEEETMRNGVVVLVDMKMVSWKFLKFLSPKNMRQANRKAEHAPSSKKEFHYVNVWKMTNTLSTMIAPFVGGEVKTYFHATLASLHAHVHPSALPVEYGGHRESPDGAKLMRDYLDPRRQRLDELLSYGYIKRSKQ